MINVEQISRPYPSIVELLILSRSGGLVEGGEKSPSIIIIKVLVILVAGFPSNFRVTNPLTVEPAHWTLSINYPDGELTKHTDTKSKGSVFLSEMSSDHCRLPGNYISTFPSISI